EVGRAQIEDHAVQLITRVGEQIADVLQTLALLVDVFAHGRSLIQQHGPNLIQRTGNERGNGIMNLTGNSALLVFLESQRAPVEVTQFLGLLLTELAAG